MTVIDNNTDGTDVIVMTDELTTLEELALKATPKVQARFAEQSAQGIVNPIVLAELVGVRPQMIYNYIGKGKLSEVLPDTKDGTNSTQKKVLDLREANTWATAYTAKKAARREELRAELLAELAAEEAKEVTVEEE